MAAIVTRRRWIKQPPFASLDRGHRLAPYVKQYYVGGDLQDGAQWYTLTASGTAASVDSVAGQAFAPTGSAAYFSTLLSASEVNARHPWSYLSYVAFTSVTTSAIVTIASGPNPASWDRALDVNTSHVFEAYVFDGSTKTASGSQGPVVGVPYALAVSCSSSLLALYVNGVLAGSTAVSNAGYNGYSSAYLLVGYGSHASATQSSVAQIGMFARLDGYAITAADAADHATNPWYLQAPRTRRLYVSVATGGFSGIPGTGSLVKTGQIPTNVLGFHFSPTTGSIVKTGQVTALAKGFVFAPATGSLVKTGQVPTLTRKFTFTPGTGSLVKTGQIPTLTRKFTFTPGTGSLVKTGQQPTLSVPFIPKTGAMVKTGHIPILTISSFGTTLAPHSWFVKAIGVKTKGSVHSQVDSDSGDTP